MDGALTSRVVIEIVPSAIEWIFAKAALRIDYEV